MKRMRGILSMTAALFVVPAALFAGGASDIMSSETITLPESIDGWSLEGPPRRIDSTNIFDYMNGAGELYLSYNFDHLAAYTYNDKNDNEILVELYYMGEARDAFGLLSLDWGGEAVEIGDTGTTSHRNGIVPSSRALYGKGLLRAWSDNVYIRVMAYREVPGIKETILTLGKMIADGRGNPPPPELLKVIEPSIDSAWKVKMDRTAYFYSHLVLNTFFYLSHENILNLNHSTEAVMVRFESEREGEAKQSVPFLVIKYPDHARASAALRDFSKAYLPDRNTETNLEIVREHQDYFHVEDGWLGYRLIDRYVALVFECPDRESARQVLSHAAVK